MLLLSAAELDGALVLLSESLFAIILHKADDGVKANGVGDAVSFTGGECGGGACDVGVCGSFADLSTPEILLWLLEPVHHDRPGH